MSITEQVCTTCGKSKPLTSEFFQKRMRMKSGFVKQCNECRTIHRTDRSRQHWEGTLLVCLRCGVPKPLDQFRENQNNKHRQNKDRNCKDCRKSVEDNRKRNSRGKEDIDSIINDRYWGMIDRAKRKGWSIDFDKQYLKELWIQQQGLCAITKIQMTLKLFNGRVPTNMSVDRIDSSKGYIKGNIQLICMAVNQMKSDLDMDTLLYFCREILDHAE